MAEDQRQGYFSGLEAKHRRRVLVWGGLGVTLVAALIAAALLMLPAEDRTPPSESPREFEPTSSPTPTATPEPGESSSATGTPGGTADEGDPDGGAPTGGDSSKPAAPLTAADRIAYVLEDAIWVAEGDGSKARKVADAGDADEFALSPDGATLAVARPGRLQFVAVKNAAVAAELKVTAAGGLSWAPDSESIAFSTRDGDAGAFELRVVGSDGRGAKAIGTGTAPRFSPDGRRIVAMTGTPGSESLEVVPASGGTARTVGATGRALDYAWASEDSLYVISQEARTTGDVPRMTIDRVTLSGDDSRVYRAELNERIVTWRYLFASPDGKSLMFAEVGDDGYSRAHVLGKDGRLIDLTVRRDTYPVGWTRSGRVLFVEGNAFQGERTDLLCANADGTGRRVIVAGASH